MALRPQPFSVVVLVVMTFTAVAAHPPHHPGLQHPSGLNAQFHHLGSASSGPYPGVHSPRRFRRDALPAVGPSLGKGHVGSAGGHPGVYPDGVHGSHGSPGLYEGYGAHESYGAHGAPVRRGSYGNHGDGASSELLYDVFDLLQQIAGSLGKSDYSRRHAAEQTGAYTRSRRPGCDWPEYDEY